MYYGIYQRLLFSGAGDRQLTDLSENLSEFEKTFGSNNDQRGSSYPLKDKKEANGSKGNNQPSVFAEIAHLESSENISKFQLCSQSSLSDTAQGN